MTALRTARTSESVGQDSALEILAKILFHVARQSVTHGIIRQ